jgi:hypothetical protein
MTHLSWRYRRRRTPQQEREFREAQRRRIARRWEREREQRAGEPVRQTRVVEFPIRDTHRPFALIRIEAQPTQRAWGRWQISENGALVANGRRFGCRQVAELLAAWLQ